jgi:hypothetical protein
MINIKALLVNNNEHNEQQTTNNEQQTRTLQTKIQKIVADQSPRKQFLFNFLIIKNTC